MKNYIIYEKHLTLYVFSSWFHWKSYLQNLHYLMNPADEEKNIYNSLSQKELSIFNTKNNSAPTFKLKSYSSCPSLFIPLSVPTNIE